MSNSALAGLDARTHYLLAAAGLADSGTYRAPPANAPVPVRVYVDPGLQQVGEFARFAAGQATLTLLREDIASPQRGATVEVAGRVYELSDLQQQDEGISVWGAAHV